MRIGSRITLAIAVAAPVLLGSVFGFFFYRDNFSTHYPIKVLSALSLRSGEIPYWNFADAGGQPLAGNPSTLTFYPDNVLYLFLPAHVAFNLHFFLHLLAAFFIVRALTRSPFAAAMYVLSGVAVSATAFYNLTVAVAVIPLAFLGAARRSPFVLGLAFGLLALAGEPVVIVGAVVAVAVLAIDRIAIRSWLLAVCIAMIIALPQLMAYAEIAGEVERSAGMSSRTVLNASLHPIRILELFAGPIVGVLNDPGGPFRERLFSTVFLGVIAAPALLRRSRYVFVVVVMTFLALGRFNPLVAAAVEAFPGVRIVRFPEKFVLPLIVALTVLAGRYFEESRNKKAWVVLTFAPLVVTALWAFPLDWFAPYARDMGQPVRALIASTRKAAVVPAREEYRARALDSEPLFGATEGLLYVINPSPEGMHALRSRLILERFDRAPVRVRQTYLRIMGCSEVAPLGWALFPTRAVVADDLYGQAVQTERWADRETVVVPRKVPLAAGRVTGYARLGQRIVIDVESAGPSLLFVNQTYFSAWSARAGGRSLETLPVDVDRLGVLVPGGRSHLELRFGRHHTAVAVAWILSSLTLLGVALIEVRDRRTGQIERAGHQDGLDL